MSPGPTWYLAPDEPQLVGRVSDAFRDTFDDVPSGVWAAPGRVNVIGEHVDYNRGLCLPFALEQRTYVAARPRTDGRVRVISAQEPAGWEGALHDVTPPLTPRWAGYAVGVPWALRAAGHDVPGFDLAIDSQLPRGAGLSSSAALECAVALAVDDLAGLGLGDDAGRMQLVRACIHAENDVAGAPTGGLDQVAALLAREDHAIVLDCLDFSMHQVPFEPAAEGLSLLVVDTRSHHALIDGQYGSRRAVCDQACALLGIDSLREVDPAALPAVLESLPHEEMRRRVRHVVTEIERVRQAAQLLADGRLGDLGPLLLASHASLRDDYEVSCAELDLAVEVATCVGAVGARMTGGGFGGSAIALLPQEDARRAATAVEEAFAGAGFAAPAFLTARPSGPGRRVASGP